MSHEHGFHSQQHTAGHEIAPVMHHTDSQQFMGSLALLGVERFEPHTKSYHIISKETQQQPKVVEAEVTEDIAEDLRHLRMYALPETD